MSITKKQREQGNGRSEILTAIWQKYYLVLLLLILIVTSSLLHQAFLTKENILNVLSSNAMIAMVSLGMFFVIVTGGIDLSVGSIIAFSGVLLATSLQAELPWGIALILPLLAMAVPGMISGAMVAFGKIPPFMATLAMMTIVRGVAYIYQVGAPRLIFHRWILFIGTGIVSFVPMPVIILVSMFAPMALILSRTPFGERLYAIGDNQEAAYLSGIHVKKHVFSVYVISSLSATIAGIVLGSRLMMGAAIFGGGYELDAIASVVIGGASLSGGTGSALNTVLGAFVFGFTANILNLLGVSTYLQMVIKGLIILSAVLISKRTSG